LEELLASFGNAEETRRRKLQEVTYTEEEIIDLLSDANAAAESAKLEAQEAADAAAAAAAEVSNAEQAVNVAYTTQPEIPGMVSAEKQIEDAFKAF
jgi:tRNA threonylcarbamoyladenosine modification (KEOPS) complex Cgi121 subunit